MAITSAICNSFKQEILEAEHNFTASSGNTFNLALYDSDATLNKSTTAYTTSEELATTGWLYSKRKSTNKCNSWCWIVIQRFVISVQIFHGLQLHLQHEVV